MSKVAEISEREKELRVKWRGELDILPQSEIVIPSEIVKRKSELFVIETDLVPRDQVWELMRSAIEDALS